MVIVVFCIVALRFVCGDSYCWRILGAVKERKVRQFLEGENFLWKGLPCSKHTCEGVMSFYRNAYVINCRCRTVIDLY